MKHEIASLNTKKTLSRSLKKLMETKPFSKITIQEIILDCGINRNTFYYHFQDMRDLLRWMLRHEAIDIVKKYDLTTDYEAAIVFVIDYLEQNQHMLNCVFDSVGCDELKRYLYDDFTEIIESIISLEEASVGAKLPDDYRKLLISFYREGISGLIVDYLHGSIDLTKEKAVKYIADIFRLTLPRIIQNTGRNCS